MKGIRSLFRLGALAMVAVLLVVALTVPAAAADQTCDDENMLDEVVILSVTPQESAFTWDASELLSYGDGAAGTYPTGQLEVQFNDINTAHTITHYDVIATPSDDPGTSAELGIDEVTTRANRPSGVGSVVTATLDLEPGTNYDIDVVAFFYSVQISPNQSNQDSLGATTFLSPPFLGGGIASLGVDADGDGIIGPEVGEELPGIDPMTGSDRSPSDRGVHYLVYKSNQELHTLHWLDPKKFGPFDHIWKVANKEGADILCTDEDGDLVDSCAADDVKGVTDYRVTVTDEDGNTEYVEEISAESANADGVFSAAFNLNDGTYTFAIDAGYVEDGKFYALSDKAQVEFDIPDDYRKYNQDIEEIAALVDDILGDVKGEDEDFDGFYDSVWNYKDWSGAGTDVVVVRHNAAEEIAADPEANPPTPVIPAIELLTAVAADIQSRERALTVYLNNLYN